MNAHTKADTIQAHTDKMRKFDMSIQAANALAPDIELKAQIETMTRAEQDMAEADQAIEASEEAIRCMGEAKAELLAQVEAIDAAIRDEGRCRSEAIERYRKARVTYVTASDRKSKLLMQVER